MATLDLRQEPRGGTENRHRQLGMEFEVRESEGVGVCLQVGPVRIDEQDMRIAQRLIVIGTAN